MSDRQPNLLFIYADQHRADVMGCAGNDIAAVSATGRPRRRQASSLERTPNHSWRILDAQ
jgi:arylsulfatase A-like enzyme